MPDLSLKEIFGIYETKNFTKKQTKQYQTTEREIFGKIDKLHENELNTKSN